jgi:Zn finger protein HypA/HybF involved in hydrogenase expression
MRTHIPSHFKQSVLKKQRYRCKDCSVFLDVYDIDHIVPYRVEKRHRLNNLQALCPTCHARKTRKEAKELRLFMDCEKTLSQRYCWACKKVVSLYFGYTDGCCDSCFTEYFKLTL